MVEQSSAPCAAKVVAAPVACAAACASASEDTRGVLEPAESCDHAARALSGVEWQGGNWLLMAHFNLIRHSGKRIISGSLDRGLRLALPVLSGAIWLWYCRIARTDAHSSPRFCWPSIHDARRQVA